MNLTSHTVFITGGTAGIGFALAKAFANLGNTVIICGRSERKLRAAIKAEPRLSGFVADVTDPHAIGHICKTLIKNNWHPSILINNAGNASSVNMFSDDPLYIDQHISSLMKTNMEAPMRLCAAFLPLLKQHPEAAIINITSGLAITPTGAPAVYCATKAALKAFTKSLRYQVEYGGMNIKVVEVLPPIVDTDMAKACYKYKIPPGKVAQAVMRGLRRDLKEIRIGKVRLLHMLYRISPQFAERLMQRGWW